MKLKIADNFEFPQDVVTSTLVVYGGKGMGKTNFGAVMVEELSRVGLRWSVLDPMGVWWGLRHSADGKGSGVECLILGGVHGDIPIEPTGGAVVADLVADEDANVIIDFSRKANGQTWGVGEKIRFVTEYGKRLFERQGEISGGKRRQPVMQVIDEAARFIPQVIPHGNPDLSKCLSVWEQITEEGRNFGLGICFLTQRSARMAKSVSELADAMLSFRIFGPRSLDAIMDWVGDHVAKAHIKSISETVRSLDRGSCLVISPGWLKYEGIAKIRARMTFDSSATPKPGEAAKRVTGKAAKPDLKKYAERMAETIERAKADDPRELKKKIAELQKQAATKPKLEIDESVTQRAIEGAVQVREREHATTVRQFTDLVEKLQRALGSISANVKNFADPFLNIELPQAKRQPIGVEIALPAKPKLAPPAPRRVPTNGSAVPLPDGERAILIACAQYPDGAERDQLSVLIGYKRSTRDVYIQRLVGRGFVEVSGQRIFATDSGVAALGSDYEPLPTGEALQSYWMNKLPEGEGKILEILIGAKGQSIPRESLDEQTGFKRSTRNVYLQRLMSRRLVEAVGRGEVRAVTDLFD